MRIGIRHKLIIAVASLTVIVIGVFSHLIIDTQEREMLDELIRGANQLSETVKSSTRYDMLTFRREGVHRIVETLGRREGIDKVLIFNKEGEFGIDWENQCIADTCVTFEGEIRHGPTKEKL